MAKCKGSYYQAHTIRGDRLVAGFRQKILIHPSCDCATGCRRVALCAERPKIETDDAWALKAIARVGFGDNCGGCDVEVDWKRGVLLDLLGCYTSVDVEIVERIGTPPDATFGALSACCGAGGARGIATRTTAKQVVLAGAFSSLIPIPPFAHAFFIASPDFSGNGINAVVTGSGAFVAPGDAPILLQVTINQLSVVNLVGGSQSVQFFNGGEGTSTFEVVFLIGV